MRGDADVTGDVHLAQLIDAAATARQVEQLLRGDLELVELLRSITKVASQALPVAVLAVEREELDGSFRRYDAEQPDGRPLSEPSAPGPHRWVLPLSDDESSPLLVVELSDGEVVVSREIREMFAMLLREARPVVERLLDLHIARQTEAPWCHTATHDSLTGLESRGTLDLTADLSEPTAVLMVDLDEFKKVNDT